MEVITQALNYSLCDWQRWCVQRELPRYVAKQIYQWIFVKKELNPHSFSNLARPIRDLLKHEFVWELLSIEARLVSADGSLKFLLKCVDGAVIEMVLMPYAERVTLCVSSQVGCRMGCSFCQTGKLGFTRNLSAGEILAQFLLAHRECKEREVSNVVFMGMGEPLDNYEAAVAACRILVDPDGCALSMGRVTISTAGLSLQIERLGKDLPVRLAISLHTVDEEQRSSLMPINRKYSLTELKSVLLEYPAHKRHGITFEYVMIAGVNDSLSHARQLVRFVHGLKAKVNLIPLNHFPGSELAPSEKESIETFQAYLSARSIPAPIRYSRGQDVSGGCGQLAAKRKSELDQDPRKLRIHKRSPPQMPI